ncbi:PAXNEB-domain-containing protein [Auriscalpium vulgare]|uniref:PAXNEB-domain-containing protein n=1 Tax=Auriscalpium vulgare TaxID=40419 RepID=A0ACB8RGC4_9AGAM|nr:PAXNEB-domain-containing protein [Auriscalpium vulgare]
MSSFKRRTAGKPATLPTGTRPSPSSTSTIITSTGIPSLDDLLGGGLPLSCSLLVLAPDEHSAYGELVQKYFIAQGLASQQTVCVVGADPQDIVTECMWMPSSSPVSASTVQDEDDLHDEADAKVKIAWRYEQMKKFQTTVAASNQSAEDFCRTFDLTCRIPRSVINEASKSSNLVFLAIEENAAPSSLIAQTIQRISDVLHQTSSSASPPFRICVPCLGSPQWGSLGPKEVICFLHLLRCLLHRHPDACAAVGLPPHLSTDGWGGPGWIRKLSFLSDASVTLAGFTADPSLSSMFPSHHGLLQIHALPAPHTLLPPSDRFSTLRGIASASGSSGGGENNLAFKCMRKRLVFETLHLDVEGGVGERRTTPSTNATALEEGASEDKVSAVTRRKGMAAAAAVEVQFEGEQSASRETDVAAEEGAHLKKAKKKVAFRSDRPELYDF